MHDLKEVTKGLVLMTALWFMAGGCMRGSNSLSPEAYVRFLEAPENKMRRQVESGNMIYTIQLATPTYVASRDAAGMKDGATKIRQRAKELQGCMFFLISMQAKAPKTQPLNTDQMALYFEGSVINDLVLRNGTQELQPVACHFENNLGLSPKNTLIAGFRTGDTLQGDLQLILNDRYAGNPLVQAGFSSDRISSLPTLNIR